MSKYGEHNGFYRDTEMSVEVRDWIKNLEQENQSLKEKVEKLTEAVEFYASPRNHNFEGGYIEDDNSLISYTDEMSLDHVKWVEGRDSKYPYEDYIGGKLARKTLAEIEGEG